ncbi:hypothetical protein ONZ45_g2427 [Pleurotus djamor]|nr:hypothetical protein ONZ45_g2427 [Pleurotus djamor]
MRLGFIILAFAALVAAAPLALQPATSESARFNQPKDAGELDTPLENGFQEWFAHQDVHFLKNLASKVSPAAKSFLKSGAKTAVKEFKGHMKDQAVDTVTDYVKGKIEAGTKPAPDDQSDESSRLSSAPSGKREI